MPVARSVKPDKLVAEILGPEHHIANNFPP
jgi:hypothetical protein